MLSDQVSQYFAVQRRTFRTIEFCMSCVCAAPWASGGREVVQIRLRVAMHSVAQCQRSYERTERVVPSTSATQPKDDHTVGSIVLHGRVMRRTVEKAVEHAYWGLECDPSLEEIMRVRKNGRRTLQCHSGAGAASRLVPKAASDPRSRSDPGLYKPLKQVDCSAGFCFIPFPSPTSKSQNTSRNPLTNS